MFRLGLFSRFPREIRDIIYEYALSTDCEDERTCSCTKFYHQSRSGLALLRSSTGIYDEALPLLYKTPTFYIKLGYDYHDCNDDASLTWEDAQIYLQGTLEPRLISSLPHNAFRLIQNLEIAFVNTTLRYREEREWPFFACTDKFLCHIKQLCGFLKESSQLQYLHISLSFGCLFSDIERMACLLVHIKELRGIREASVDVFGYQHVPHPDGFQVTRGIGTRETEPRWYLTDKYSKYLEDLMSSPHGTPTPLDESFQVFDDIFGPGYGHWSRYTGCRLRSYEDDSDASSELTPASSPVPSSASLPFDQQTMNYLCDVYDTNDCEFLQGNMPSRWQKFLSFDVSYITL